MVKYENDCCGCDGHYNCHGSGCGLSHVPHYYCDVCGDEIYSDEHYVVEGDDLCEYCLKEKFRKES